MQPILAPILSDILQENTAAMYPFMILSTKRD